VARAYIAIGGNIGDVPDTLSHAVRALDKAHGVRVRAVSPLFETEPVGGPEGQPAFLNGAIELETTLSPGELLSVLMGVEKGLGRVREVADGPRTVDLDILLMDDSVVEEEGLSIPHPRMHQRSFVLVPLAAIAPEALHPVLKKTVSRLLFELGPIEGVRPFGKSFDPVGVRSTV
jgi:2-amino-4-hydroxy-6-hydroxymethyldihydropteridine diphosphokinase